ncbi:hypothetical protein BG005_004011, partial [Podila minutissima]
SLNIAKLELQPPCDLHHPESLIPGKTITAYCAIIKYNVQCIDLCMLERFDMLATEGLPWSLFKEADVQALALRTHGSWDAIDAATSGTIYWLHKEFTARITDIDLPDFGTAFKSSEHIDTTVFIHDTNAAVAAVETEPENTAETPETPETPWMPEMPETPEATAVLFIDSEALVAAGSIAQEEQEGVDNGSNMVFYM